MRKEVPNLGQVTFHQYTGAVVVPELSFNRPRGLSLPTYLAELALSHVDQGLVDSLQTRFNQCTGETVVPRLPQPEFESKRRVLEGNGHKPDCAYINSEGLRIIRNRINKRNDDLKRDPLNCSDDELANLLTVFEKGTEIYLNPPHKETSKYSICLGIDVIAWKTPYMDTQDVEKSVGYEKYQLLGVYRQFKGTGKPSTDKAIRGYATIQRSDRDHPEDFFVESCFFTRPDKAVLVKKSKLEKTSFYWKEKK